MAADADGDAMFLLNGAITNPVFTAEQWIFGGAYSSLKDDVAFLRVHPDIPIPAGDSFITNWRVRDVTINMHFGIDTGDRYNQQCIVSGFRMVGATKRMFLLTGHHLLAEDRSEEHTSALQSQM